MESGVWWEVECLLGIGYWGVMEEGIERLKSLKRGLVGGVKEGDA